MLFRCGMERKFSFSRTGMPLLGTLKLGFDAAGPEERWFKKDAVMFLFLAADKRRA